VIKLSVCLLLTFFVAVVSAQEINIIPLPGEMKVGKGSFTITNQTVIAYDDKTKLSALFLSEYLRENFGIELRLTMHNRDQKAILLMSGGGQEKKGAYILKCDNNGISIGGDDEGVFYGIQTLIQLLPIQNQKSKNQTLQIPQLSITDYPRFPYRGLHLDVSRHFFPVDFIKKYIDYIALHKMNYFHWHLTEDQGWRIEIKKYPRLTSVGAWRNGTIIGRYPGTGNDGIKYGGFYTQEQIKEIVKYAADRYITVIPEIEMPGHSSAAIAAYPELSCFPDKPTVIPTHPSLASQLQQRMPTPPQDTLGHTTKLVQETWGVFDDVFCAGKENTFKFLEGVLDEVLALFPSKYIHVGGDECPKAHWKICLACQQRMKDNGLKDEHELQSYFIQRMEKYLNKKGRTLIGWDEILEGGLAPNAAVMSWRGEQGGIDAAKQNHDVIMTPGNPVYFDHSQSENEDSVTIGGYNPIEKVYAYEPIPKELNAEQAKHILGAQANMWTEYMGNTKKVEYMLFPRIAALSEVLWSPKDKKDWDDFEKRLEGQFKRYDVWKVNYSNDIYSLKSSVVSSSDFSGVYWKFDYKPRLNYGGYWVRVFNDSIPFGKDIDIKKKMTSGRYVAWLCSYNETGTDKTYIHDKVSQNFSINKASGKKITLTTSASNKYPGDGPFTLVNGVQNEKGLAKAKEFLGFSGTDCDAIIDLGQTTDVSEIIVHFLVQPSSWIYPPDSIIFKIFDENMQKTGGAITVVDKTELFDLREIKIPVPGKGRYVQVFVKNYGTIPEGHPGAGNKAWLFVDEIEVN
jgi:hexosaminidase